MQAPRPSLSLAGSTCTSIHGVELGQCSRFAKRLFAKGPGGKRTAFCAAAVSARRPKAQNAHSPNQPRTVGTETPGSGPFLIKYFLNSRLHYMKQCADVYCESYPDYYILF